jgi:TPR repeat protein
VESGLALVAVKANYEKATKLYEKALKHGEKNQKLPPATDAGWTQLNQLIALAQGIEASLRRDGLEGCIYGNEGCPQSAPASCLVH